MKKLIAAFSIIAALAPSIVLAANSNGMVMERGAMQAEAAPALLTAGVVKKIDKAGSKLTIAHDALPNGMPAMTMAFRVKDVSWLDKVKDGQKIRFAADSIGGVMTVVRLELPK